MPTGTPEIPDEDSSDDEESDIGFNDQDSGWILGDKMPRISRAKGPRSDFYFPAIIS
jgi:hypothetical protein